MLRWLWRLIVGKPWLIVSACVVGPEQRAQLAKSFNLIVTDGSMPLEQSVACLDGSEKYAKRAYRALLQSPLYRAVMQSSAHPDPTTFQG